MSQIRTNSKLHDTIADDENLCSLPPLIRFNPRYLIGPERVSISSFQDDLQKYLKNSNERKGLTNNRHFTSNKPIQILWCPEKLTISLENDTITSPLLISNSCRNTIMIRSLLFWSPNDDAKSGAKWSIKPKTKRKLAPGLTTFYYIKAIPREKPKVPSVEFVAQLVASYNRSIEVAYFAIPITAKFLKYIPPTPPPTPPKDPSSNESLTKETVIDDNNRDDKIVSASKPNLHSNTHIPKETAKKNSLTGTIVA